MKTSVFALVAALASTPVLAQDLPQASSQWFTDAQARIQDMLDRQPNTGRAKNVILFVADGNGVGTNYAIRLFDGQQKGMMGEETSCPTGPPLSTRRWSRPITSTPRPRTAPPPPAP